MKGLRAWFDARTKREQRLLLVMLALAVLTLVWAGIIRPLGDGLSSARERHADAVLRLGETEAQVDAIHAVSRRPSTPLIGTLADSVRTEATQAGFTIAGLDPDGGDRVRLTLANVRPGALLPWLARLEDVGILVDSATLTNNGDRTVGAALVLKERQL